MAKSLWQVASPVPAQSKTSLNFIIEHQARSEEALARFEAAFDQERQERLRDLPRLARVEAAFVTLTEIAEIQSRHLDSHAQEFTALLERADARHAESIAYLKQILDRLS